MARRRTTAEQIEDVIKKEHQMKAREKQLRARKKEEDRKARTRRLILIGAEVESILGRPIEEKNLLKLSKFLKDQERRGNYFSNAMKDEKSDSQ